VSEPKWNVVQITDNAMDGDLYKSEFKLTITSVFALPNLYVRVEAPTITGEMDVTAQRTGIDSRGNGGQRPGYRFDNLQNAYGVYLIRVWSRQPEHYTITLGLDDLG
jgi:hypothetical protein